MTLLALKLPPSGSGAIVNLKDVSRSFGNKHVLDKLNLTVNAGEFLAIIGKSGSGKSTLLRILAGLDEQFEGRLHIARRDRNPVSTRIMYQEPRLLPWMRVLDNISIGLGPHHRSGDDRLAERALVEVGLNDRGQEWPSILSGGQKQRVALARALVSTPDLLVLDEPLGALDALTRIEMQTLVERIWHEHGFTAILVTHDVTEALTLADRIVLIEDGKIALDLEVPLPRPRRRGTSRFGLLEEKILKALLKNNAEETDYSI